MLSVSAALLLATIGAAPPGEKASARLAPELSPPIKLTAGSKPIDVDVGHAAPCVADLKGDGKPCLLVGQFGEGKLRVYPNVGTRSRPRFDTFEWFRAGGAVATVPAS